VIVYADTSSVVKLYVDEPGRPVVRSLFERAAAIFTSGVAYPETRAALARRRREGAMTARDFAAAKGDFESEWTRFVAISPGPEICHEAGNLAERYGLRGFDSIHLASFSAVLRGLEGRDDVEFSSFDDTLNSAAQRLARSIR
jgi:predicted nucleic acid-binding protein